MTHDLIIMGAGPGGYVAAERAGRAGLKVLLIEKNALGGVCLNEGCIPSKTLLNSAKLYYQATHGAAFGVHAPGAEFRFDEANARKTQVMDTLRDGIAGLMSTFGVDVLHGEARLLPDRRVAVDGQVYEGRNVVIATGSSPARPPIPGMNSDGVVDSTGILNLDALPRHLTVIGGGVIGCEFACFFGSIGIPVTVIEMLPEICPPVDTQIARMLRGELTKKNVHFHTGATVLEITDDEVVFDTRGRQERLDRDLVLVATGRTPNVANLGFEEAGLDFDRGGIRINDLCATNLPGVWAIGDVTGLTWLAHAASRMGTVVVNTILGRTDRMRYDAIPGVVYTSPEVATVGLTESAARERGIPVKTARMPLTANGRFLAEQDGARGAVKVVVHSDTGQLLGVHMIGGACSEMIFGAAAMIETELRVNEIEEIVFPHPTVSETIHDALTMAGEERPADRT